MVKIENDSHKNGNNEQSEFDLEEAIELFRSTDSAELCSALSKPFLHLYNANVAGPDNLLNKSDIEKVQGHLDTCNNCQTRYAVIEKDMKLIYDAFHSDPFSQLSQDRKRKMGEELRSKILEKYGFDIFPKGIPE